jgi:hypothetical protein
LLNAVSTTFDTVVFDFHFDRAILNYRALLARVSF